MNYEEVKQDTMPDYPAELKAPENVLLGFLGALIGAAIGAASIILLSQIGYVASISGVILAFCTLKGYELLGKGLSKKGIVICIILMAVTPFLADWIDWAIILMQSTEGAITFGEAFAAIPLLLADGSIELMDYLSSLGMIYLFVILGGFYTVKKAVKQ